MTPSDSSGQSPKAEDEGDTASKYNHRFHRRIVNKFLPISLNICVGSSKEQSH